MNEAQIVDRPEEAISAAKPESASNPRTFNPVPSPETERATRWVAAARFLIVWIMPLVLTLYLKWYALEDAGGFERVARSIGSAHLSLRDEIGFFRLDILTGFCAIPALILLVARYVKPRLISLLLGGGALGISFLLAIQLRSLAEVGRYLSLQMMWIALQWGLQEPSANVGYLSMRGLIALAVGCVATILALEWAVRAAERQASSLNALRFLRIAGEIYLLCVIGFLAIGWKSSIPDTPYHESTLVRSVQSLWKENAVDTGEFAAFDFDHNKPSAQALPPLSAADLVSRYRQLANEPPHQIDLRYFG